MESRLIAIFATGLLLALGTSAQESESWRPQISNEEVKFNVALSSGTIVKNVVYKQQKLHGLDDRFYIFFMTYFGLKIEGVDGKPLEGISHDEFMELLEIAIEKVKSDHDGALSGVRIDFGFVEDFWVYLVEQMQLAPIPPHAPTDPKSRIFIRPFSDAIRKSALVSDVCAMASRIGRHCPEDNYYQGDGINVRLDSLMMPWGEATHHPDSGLERKGLWFFVIRYEQGQ